MSKTVYKIVYKNEGVLSSFPATILAGLGCAYEPGQAYQMPETGPFFCWFTLDSARNYLDRWGDARAHFEIWECEAEPWILDTDEICYGILDKYLNQENATAYWAKMLQMSPEERREYLTERGAAIGIDGRFKRCEHSDQEPRGVRLFEYGTYLCATVKLVQIAKTGD